MDTCAAVDVPLKPRGGSLDTSRGMLMHELKRRVQRADYIVYPALVAEAMLRHAISHRRCWNPRSSWATPADSNVTWGGPSRTVPIHVTGAADSAA
jgi:hypothetical protein